MRIFGSSLRIFLAARLPTKCCPNRGVPLPHLTLFTLVPAQNHRTRFGIQLVEGTGDLLPYVDINPHKTGPKWPAYVGVAILLVATVAMVILALATH